MTPQAEAEMLIEEARQQAAFVALVKRWPEFRKHFAFGMLGIAVAIADTMGCDVEAWLTELRRRHPKPDVLVPAELCGICDHTIDACICAATGRR